MRPSSPPQRRFRSVQTAQYQLPFGVETAVPSAGRSSLGSEPPSEGSETGTLPAPIPAPQGSDAPIPHGHRRKDRKRKLPAKTTAAVDGKLLVSREEAAAMLSISVRGVDYYISTKRLSTRRMGTRVLIPIEDVRKFARSDHPERMAG